jgi:hypothetical protein
VMTMRMNRRMNCQEMLGISMGLAESPGGFDWRSAGGEVCEWVNCVAERD